MSTQYLDLVATLETANGRKTIKGPNGEDSFNNYNIKLSESEKAAGEIGYIALDKAEGSRDKYKVFKSKADADAAFSGLISRRYPEAAEAMKQPWSLESAHAFATGLKKRGYATDPLYVQKLTNIAKGMKAEGNITSVQDRAVQIAASVNAQLVRPQDRKAWDGRIATDLFERSVKEDVEPDMLDMLGAAMTKSTGQRIVGGMSELLFGPKYQPEEGYTPDYKTLPQSADTDLLEAFKKTKSKAEAAHVISDYTSEQERLKVMGARGGWTALGLGFGAEILDPVNWVAQGAAVRALGKLGMGSIQLAKEGRAGASVASAIGENLASGTALELAAQQLEGKSRPQDLMISAVADGLIGAVTGVHGVSSMLRASQLIEKAGASAAEEALTTAKRAMEDLGPSAQAGELRGIMDNMFAKDITDNVKRNMSEVPSEQRVMPQELSEADAKLLAQIEEDLPSARTDGVQIKERQGANLDTYTVHRELGLDLPEVKGTDVEAQALRAANIEAIVSTPGVHMSKAVQDNPVMTRYAKVLEELRLKMAPDLSIHLTDGSVKLNPNNANGAAYAIKPKTSLIALKQGSGMATVLHEFGHVIFQHKFANLPVEQKLAMAKVWKEWQDAFDLEGGAKAAVVGRSRVGTLTGLDSTSLAARGGVSKSLNRLLMDAFPTIKEGSKYTKYYANFDEFAAEQWTKHAEQLASTKQGANSLPKAVVSHIAAMLRSALDLFNYAKANKLFGAKKPFKDFFNDLMKGLDKQIDQTPATVGKADGAADAPSLAVAADAVDVVAEIMNDPIAIKYGINMAPVGTLTQRKQAQAMIALYKRAENWAARNPMDEAYNKRIKNLSDNNIFNVASSGLLMLKSPNPLMRMIASQLVEDASGVLAKRNATAAIAKTQIQKFMLGNVLHDFEAAYSAHANDKTGGLIDALITGKKRDEFNKLVAAEIEARGRMAGHISADENVKAAADSLEAAYQRIANEQRKWGTLGNEGLAATSRGYMPHRMSAHKVISLTNDELQVVHSSLVDQFSGFGWDITFSDQLATSYLSRVRERAGGDYGSNIGGGNPGAATMIEDALRGMDLPDDVIRTHMANFTKGAANFTKKRLDLDLNAVHNVNGKDFRLMDIFETDHISLVRGQAGRASGEVALTKFGVQGKPGAKLLRDALQYGETDGKTGNKALEAYDQAISEFFEEPVRGVLHSQGIDRLLAANSLIRLGGAVWNQIAETINGIFHIGVLGTLNSIGSIKQMIDEISTLRKGGVVDNGFLRSIEREGGEFGTESYKVVMPWDNPTNAYPTYGQDSVTLFDRLIRGGGHLQAKLSGWRMIHSAQQRGMAQEIVKKVMRYAREGNESVALKQFGINDEVAAYIKANHKDFMEFDAAGNPTRLEVGRIVDPDIRDQVVQAVWRGTSQIIQGTFIGERGKWAHDGWAKILTQFRAFSIVSMEKQWGRQRNSHGAYAAFGMMMGAMTMAAPIYIARTYYSSIGREDQQEYLDKRLKPEMIARATMNYIASSGMVGDFADLLSQTVLPESWGVSPTGGRAGTESDFVGNFIAPATSVVNDGWKWAQSPLETKDLMKITPMGNLPGLLLLTNGLRD